MFWLSLVIKVFLGMLFCPKKSLTLSVYRPINFVMVLLLLIPQPSVRILLPFDA
jgi:hypothetical protein